MNANVLHKNQATNQVYKRKSNASKMFYLGNDCKKPENSDSLLMPSTSEDSVNDYIQTFKPSFTSKNTILDNNMCKNISMSNFEDLRKFGIALRKALNRSSTKITYFDDNQVQNAYDNLTYVSSIDVLNDQSDPMQNCGLLTVPNGTQNDDVLKKTLKSIKRKDKLKKTRKSESFRDATQNQSHMTSVEDLDESRKQLEKQLKKKYRSKSYARSIRRAKTVYYLNQRSKSLEDLTNASSNIKSRYTSELDIENGLNKKCNSTMSSCSSFTTGCASDLSSSYFHELSDLSPDVYDSDSIYSDSVLLKNVDWDAYLPELANVSTNSLLVHTWAEFKREKNFLQNEFYSSSSDDESEDNQIETACTCICCSLKKHFEIN
jgi:hypothetical protein